MRKTINCNTGWTFHEGFSADYAAALNRARLASGTGPASAPR